ncbi:DNA cytosine methyltransferase [Streptomyces erythrochromogenes]|uniref:DNA cytosine methyltransferase n=1 Tax=Streptomyces erythrochromogenes TaxID=285574 RepID=UPI003637E3BD
MSRDQPRIGSLCTGYGGLDAAVHAVFGGTTAWVSDIDPGARQIIAHRMPDVPNLGDLTTTDWAAVEPVDIVLGGYPCQPFSTAGKRKGTADERHIWPYIADALRVLRPRIAVFENVAGHLRLGFDTVLADLARLGFDAEWCLVRASEVGAPHARQRLFILAVAADTPDLGHERRRSARRGRAGFADGRDAAADTVRLLPGDDRELPSGRNALRQWVRHDAPGRGPAAPADTDGVGRRQAERHVRTGQPDPAWGRFTPAVHRWASVLGRRAPGATDDRGRLSPLFVEWLMGLSAGWVTNVPGLSRTQQLKALGNGVVPQQAEAAIRLLAERATSTAAAA